MNLRTRARRLIATAGALALAATFSVTHAAPASAATWTNGFEGGKSSGWTFLYTSGGSGGPWGGILARSGVWRGQLETRTLGGWSRVQRNVAVPGYQTHHPWMLCKASIHALVFKPIDVELRIADPTTRNALAVRRRFVEPYKPATNYLDPSNNYPSGYRLLETPWFSANIPVVVARVMTQNTSGGLERTHLDDFTLSCFPRPA